MQQYDTIIIGAGHNGLICAAYLGQKGQRVLVLEASDSLGGLAASREFHPGFKSSVAHTLSHFSEKVTAELNLAAHGYDLSNSALPTIGLNADGEHLTLADAGVTGVSDKDAASYSEYLRVMQQFSDLMKPFWHKTMPRIAFTGIGDAMTFAQMGLKLRLLGKKAMGEFMRIATLPARDLMDENFDNALLKAMLSWDGLLGSKMAPRSPNATVFSILYRMIGKHRGAHAIPAGGMEKLIAALQSAAEKAGVEIRTATPVKRIAIQADENGLKVSGVELAGGEIIEAARVVSATDPQRTFLDLVGVENLQIGFTNRIRRLRTQGYVAKLHLALKELPKFTGLDNPDGRMIIAPDMDAIEFAYDDAKYGGYSENPVMELLIPSLHDDTIAPAGQHVLSAHVMYVPCELKGGWTDEAKAALYIRIIETIEVYAPGIGEQIIHGELLTPRDLEQSHNVTGGHWHHAELSIDQMLMMRPTYEAGQYSTPIPGLYLCGAGSHPGGGLMGGPGHNAAREILK